MNVEERIHLNKFVPRAYQIPLFDALENKGYRRVLGIMPRRCLSGNSYIVMSDGSYKLLKDIKVGDKILSWDGNSFVADIVINKWSTGIKKTRTITSLGKIPLIASEDHKVATTSSDGKSTIWKKVSGIKSNRQLMQYGGLNNGKVNNPDLAELLGYLYTDGYVSGYQQPKFTNINMDILKRVEDLAKKIFDVDVIWRPKGNGYDLGLSNKTRGGGTFTNPIKELFRDENQDVPKTRKRFLSIIWQFDDKSLSRFFAAVISGDGTIYNFKSNTLKNRLMPPTTEITLNIGNNKDLALDYYWLLRKMGILPHVPYLEKQCNWKVKIGKSPFVRRLLLSGPIYGKERQQVAALENIAANTKEAKIFKGCYRTRVKVYNGPDEELFDIETKNNHNFIANGYVVHNSGKDLTAWNISIRQCLTKKCTVFYCLPLATRARAIIWEGMTNDGDSFISFIPPTLISSINQATMSIRFTNGSLLRCLGANNFDNALVGTNAYGIVFSEFSQFHPDALSYASPILAANGGWWLGVSTPRGKSYMYQLHQFVKDLPDWFVYHRGVTETKHIPEDVLFQERVRLGEEMYQQEYECSYERGIVASFWGKLIDQMRIESRITHVPYDPSMLVNTSWDIGVNDPTTIIFYQVPESGNSIKIIDTYTNNNVGIEHYIQLIRSKPYIYNKHFAPHDINVRNFDDHAITRYMRASQLGLNFTVLKQAPLVEGIEYCYQHFARLWIDEGKCKNLIDAMENYRRKWDDKLQMYDPKPEKSRWNHFADAFRYLCQSLPILGTHLTSAEFERQRNISRYGPYGPIGSFLNSTNDYDFRR